MAKPGMDGAKVLVTACRTPSLNRPFDIYNQVNALRKGLLGSNKWEFGRNYCKGQWRAPGQPQSRDGLDALPRWPGIRYNTHKKPPVFAVYDGCRYDEELHGLLRTSVMIRRLKAEVLMQLPPLLRTVVRVDTIKASQAELPPDWPEAEEEGEPGQGDEEARVEDLIAEDIERRERKCSVFHGVGRAKVRNLLKL
jgi:hypothetical protein